MSKLLYAVILMLALSGCSTLVPVKEKWPAVPAELLVPAVNLIPLAPEKRELSDLIENANNNFTQYYLLKNQYTAWQKWYADQKGIYEIK